MFARGTLLRKYALYFAGLVSALLTLGLSLPQWLLLSAEEMDLYVKHRPTACHCAQGIRLS